jgi:hypothetical protein
MTLNKKGFSPPCVSVASFAFSPRADDEFWEGIFGNQKFKKMYYLNVSKSGIESR